MKKLAFFLISFLFVPAMLFAQYEVTVSTEETTELKVEIPGYNDKVPAASMTLRFEFDQTSEILTVHCGPDKIPANYSTVWLPQHEVAYDEIGDYMNNRGVKMIKSFNYSDQESFLDFSSKKIRPAIEGIGMTFDKVYDVQPKNKVKKELDFQMIPLEGDLELNLHFKMNPGSNVAVLKLHNPIPMDRSGRKGTLGFVGDDVVINISLERCKDAEQMIQTIHEYEALFEVAENKLIELKRNPSTQKTYKDFILNEWNVINTDRFAEAACDQVQDSYNNLLDCIERIKGMATSTSSSTPSSNSGSESSSCDVKKLDAEVKAVTTKLNNMVNDWSLASDASSKAEKKSAFLAEVMKFDNKLKALPASCKDKIDKKLMKNYEFVKKLIK